MELIKALFERMPSQKDILVRIKDLEEELFNVDGYSIGNGVSDMPRVNKISDSTAKNVEIRESIIIKIDSMLEAIRLLDNVIIFLETVFRHDSIIKSYYIDGNVETFNKTLLNSELKRISEIKLGQSIVTDTIKAITAMYK